jgi:DNA-binding NtrC family response regulator
MRGKILLVDDDLALCNSIAMLLREEGYCVEAATDSREGTVLINKNRYDVAIFDYKMEGLNGIDLLMMTKKINPRCAVFILSGMLNIEKLCEKAKKAGLLAGVIGKPFDVVALLQKIAAFLKKVEICAQQKSDRI